MDQNKFQNAFELHRQGKLEKAMTLYEQVLQEDPNHFDALQNSALIAYLNGSIVDAELCFLKAEQLNPQSAALHANYGVMLQKCNRLEEALARFDRAICIAPDYAEALSGRGMVLKSMGLSEQAILNFVQAIIFKPEYPDAYRNLALTLYQLGRHDDMIKILSFLSFINPYDAEVYNTLGCGFHESKKFVEAIKNYDKAISINPSFVAAYRNRSLTSLSLRLFDKALADNICAFLLKDKTELLWDRLQIKLHFCDWNNIEAEITYLNQAIMDRRAAFQPFQILFSNDCLITSLMCARSWSAAHISSQKELNLKSIHKHEPRIRLVYLSADFRSHPVAQALKEIVSRHDRSRFEVIGISIGPRDESALGHELIKNFDAFFDLYHQSDCHVVDFIRGLNIDILLNTAVWTDHFRPAIIACRAAAVQVNFLSAWTSGIDAFDYMIADPRGVLNHEKIHYSERIVDVLGFPNDTSQNISEGHRVRSSHNLPEESFIFGCFNAPNKINPAVFNVWMNVLRRVPKSVLWLKQRGGIINNLRSEAFKRNIDPSRLIFAADVPSTSDHLARLSLVDLTLDTLPYGGHTTMRDSLYAGVPIITQTGKSFVGRIGTILLEDAGLPELVCRSAEEYEDLAVELALDSARLRCLKEKLKKNRFSHRVFDSREYVFDLEAAYEVIYDRFVNGLSPAHIDLETIRNFRKNVDG